MGIGAESARLGQALIDKARARQRSQQQSGGGLQDIIGQMQAAQQKANLLNEQRYRQALGQFENLGKAGRARIEQQTAQRQAAATQGLVSRGLGGTTVTSAVERGIASDAESQRQQLEEGIAVQRAGLIERRSDVGPDLGMFANLLQTAGQQQQQAPYSVVTRMGAQAAAGKTIFGQPFRYGGVRQGQTQSQMDAEAAARRAEYTRTATSRGTSPLGG